jgi:hypothetical protein
MNEIVVWNIGRLIVTGESRSTWREACASATLQVKLYPYVVMIPELLFVVMSSGESAAPHFQSKHSVKVAPKFEF